MITILAAIDKQGAIGKDNSIPWKLPSDLRAFSKRTQDGVVIMGRKTWESLPIEYRPLPRRTNIIITSQKDYYAPGAFITDSLEYVLNTVRVISENNVFVIGGAQIYEQAINHPNVTKMIISHVNTTIENPDAYFPNFKDDWVSNARTQLIHDTDDQYAYSELQYCRKTKKD